MKYYPRLGLYKAANVTFNPETHEARSYEWWLMSRRIGNQLVFNAYPYSNTTIRHQWKLRRLLADLGISHYVSVQCPNGLQDLGSGIEFCETKIERLRKEIEKPGTRKAKNEERKTEMYRLAGEIAVLRDLIMAEARSEVGVA